MENFQNEQNIPWIKVVNPSTGQVYYISSEGTVTLQNTVVSNAVTASYALNGGGGGSTNTGSLLTTASFSTPNLTFTKGDRSTFDVDISSLTVTSASYALTSSYFSGSVTNAISSSYALTASYVQNAVSSSFSSTASYVQNAVTASYALTSSKTTAISGTTNYVSKFLSDATIGNSQIFDNGTNVGIGTTSPLTKLHVAINDNAFAGNTLFENTNTGSSAQAAIAFKTANNADSFAIGQINSGGGAVLYNAANTGINFYTNASLRMTIAAGGNVGINTTNPTSASLQVNGNIFASSFTGSLLGTSSFSNTASYVNNLNQNVTIGNITSTPSTENTLNIYPPQAGGTGEGGQILLAASGGLYSSASMLDNWQNTFRILKGTNTGGSTAGLVYVDLQNGNTQFVGAVTASAYSGLPNAWLSATRNSSQTIGSGTWANRDIIFDQYSSNNFTYNSSTGIATLNAGKTYRITARLAWSAAGIYTLKFRLYNQTTSAFTGPTVELIQSPNGTYNVSDNTLETIYAVGGSDVDISIRTTSDTNALTGEYIRGDLNTQLIIQQIS